MNYLKIMLVSIGLFGCSDSSEEIQKTTQAEESAITDNKVESKIESAESGSNDSKQIETVAPELWSAHKQLKLTAKECALVGRSTLESLNFTSVVQNKYFTYGVFETNRAAVKCVENSDGSFVYIAVAGPKRKMVEILRNEIYKRYKNT